MQNTNNSDLLEYTFTFKKNTANVFMNSTFIASTTNQAYDIAQKYIKDCLNNNFEIVDYNARHCAIYD